MNTTIISLGGSIVTPDKPDSDFLKAFRASVEKYFADNPDARLVFVVGGGAAARTWQNAARAAMPEIDNGSLDWLGIRATHLNAELVRAVFNSPDSVVTNPCDDNIQFTGKVLVAGGWKPGFSTDTDAVYLARRFGAQLVINLSNIEKVYTDDPRKNPDARPIDSISWKDFIAMVGDQWTPGKNVPFDPIASKLAAESNIRVICSDGHNIANTISILTGRPFVGTVIGA